MEEDYKKKIIELVNAIDNKEFIQFIYKLIISLKKKWDV